MPYENLYVKKPIDFAALADHDARLKSFLKSKGKGRSSIDFKDEGALRALAVALLQRDFQLHLELPNDRLCPMIPGRLDYVVWILNLIENAGLGREESLRGLDIGTGASAIYTLLSTSMEPRLSMVGIDVDAKSLECARKNVTANDHLSERLQIIGVDSGKGFFSQAGLDLQNFHFTMCNPPFYASKEEIARLAEEKEEEPPGICTGGEVEMITQGGEKAFLARMVGESKEAANIKWFSSLVGRFDTLAAMIKQLKDVQVASYTINQFQQGRTKRWAVAWTFGSEKLADGFARPDIPALKDLLPPSTSLLHKLTMTKEEAWQIIKQDLQDVDIPVREEKDFACMVEVAADTWSRAARRRRAKGARMDVEGTSLKARLEIVQRFDQASLTLTWLFGKDKQLVDSLWSHLLRSLQSKKKS